MNVKIGLLFLLWPLRRFKIFCKRVQPKIDKLIEDTYWSSTIEFFSENYMVFVVCSFIESQSLRFGRGFTATENYMSALACCGMIFSFLFPMAIGRLYMNNLKHIDPLEVPFDKISQLTAKEFKELLVQNDIYKQKRINDEAHKHFIHYFGVLLRNLKVR
jgi:hypothetical protein